MGKVVSSIKTGSFLKLRVFETKSLNLGYQHVTQVVDALSTVETLDTIDLDSYLRPADVLYVINKCKNLKYLSFKTEVKDALGNSYLKQWIALLNIYFRYISFGHNVFLSIPNSLLQHDRYCYSTPCPLGLALYYSKHQKKLSDHAAIEYILTELAFCG